MSVPPDHDPLLGRSLGDTYEIVRVVAEGGMGRVYEARHQRIRTKRLAIKVIHPELLRNPEIVARFQREVEASAAISSPHVAGVYDVGRTPTGQPFLVAEFLEGRDLAEFLETFPKLPVGFAVRIVRQACRGLAAAHRSDVVHRDIKPENIFLTGDLRRPHVKVVDFGISRLDDGQAKNLTQTGVVIGTPAFMPPEQAKGARVDHRADVYAAAAVLYTMLTGRDPFASESSAETLFAVLTREPTAPREIEPSIPVHLEAIIQRAMAKEPDDRYATIDEFAEVLAPYDPDESVAIESPEPGPGSAASARGYSQVAAEETAARTARTSLVGLLALAGAWLVAGFVSVGGALVRLGSTSSSGMTEVETNLLLLAVFAALITPSVLGIRKLRRDVWPNTAKVVALVLRLRTPVLATVVTYGLLALVVRPLDAVVLRHAERLAWPGWDLLFVGISATVGAWLLAVPRVRPRVPATTWSRLETLPAWFPASAIATLLMATLTVSVQLRPTPASRSGKTHVAAIEATSPPSDDRGDTIEPEQTSDGETAEANESGVTASPAALEQARTQGIEALTKLGERHPRDAAVFRALALAHASAKPPDHVPALGALTRALDLDPALASDVVVHGLVRDATTGPADARDVAARILAERLGSHGPDLMFESVRSGDAFAAQAIQLLADPKVRDLATPALRIAFDLERAASCKDKLALVERAEQAGDQRSVEQLEKVAQGRPRGCGFLGSRACPPKCRREAKRMRSAITTIQARTTSPASG